MTVCALVPIKNAAKAKTRLRAVLSGDETAFVAKEMAIETIDALTHSPCVQRVVLLGDCDTASELVAEFGCEVAREDPALDLSANLFAAIQGLALDPSDTLAIFPADLPLITPVDIEDLLRRHEHGLTLCPAATDGGTNALLITPPDAIAFRFGDDSARKHRAAARAAGLEVQTIHSPALSRDIDTPADLEWLCHHLRSGRLFESLRARGILSKVANLPAALSA